MANGDEIPHFHDYEIDGRSMHYVHVGPTACLWSLWFMVRHFADNMLGYLEDQKLTSIAQVVAVDRPGLWFF
ncbi:MAG: hypothetical protein R2788_06430 [Saprospiraceae bacterium]